MRKPVLLSLGVLLLPAALLLPIPGCGGQQSSQSGTPTPAAATVTLGASGGVVSSSDGRLEVKVPAAALPAGATLSITPSTVPGAVGFAYDVAAGGAKLAAPVTFTLHYAGLDLAGRAANEIRVGAYVNGHWQALKGYAIDTQAQTIHATADALGSFAATAQAQVCLARAGAFACGSSNSGGSTTNGGGGGDTPTSSGDTCPTPSCADINPCADVPNATSTTCDVGPDGSWSATCCYDPTKPVCVTSGGGTSGGSGGGAEPPPPSCATATCDGSSTLASCTDYPGGSGYEASCCYPPGVLPDDTSGSNTGGGGGTGTSDPSTGGTSSNSGGSTGGSTGGGL